MITTFTYPFVSVFIFRTMNGGNFLASAMMYNIPVHRCSHSHHNTLLSFVHCHIDGHLKILRCLISKFGKDVQMLLLQIGNILLKTQYFLFMCVRKLSIHRWLALKPLIPCSFTNSKAFNWHILIDNPPPRIVCYLLTMKIPLTTTALQHKYASFSSFLYNFHKHNIFYQQCDILFLLPLYFLC